MTSFKQWISEITLASDGETDNAVVQTNQATSQIGDFALSDPKFGDQQVQTQKLMGNPAQARQAVIKWSMDAFDQAPSGVAQKTNAANVNPYVAKGIGQPDLFRGYKMMMQKRMQKKMKKQ